MSTVPLPLFPPIVARGPVPVRIVSACACACVTWMFLFVWFLLDPSTFSGGHVLPCGGVLASIRVPGFCCSWQL